MIARLVDTRTRTRAAAALAALILTAAAPVHASFVDAIPSGGVLRPLRTQLTSALAAVAPALPFIGASSGFVYHFDVETGTFRRESAIFGQLFLERADPIGRHKTSVALSYLHFDLESFEGKDLDRLSDRAPSQICFRGDCTTFVIPSFSLSLETHDVTASATYGVTDDLDVNVTVPLLASDFRVRAAATIIPDPPLPRHPVRPLSASDSAVGIGDVLLRSKYRLSAASWAHTAFGLVLRVPSGNEDDFQGVGHVEVAPIFYASRDALLVRRVKLQAHGNAGVNVNTDDVDHSEGRWGLGLDCAVAERVSAAVAFLGRHPFSRIGRPGAFDVRRLDGPPAPLFGFRGRRVDYYDFSAGARIDLWRQRALGFAGALIPLSKDGFRSAPIPVVGIEAIF